MSATEGPAAVRLLTLSGGDRQVYRCPVIASPLAGGTDARKLSETV